MNVFETQKGYDLVTLMIMRLEEETKREEALIDALRSLIEAVEGTTYEKSREEEDGRQIPDPDALL